MVTLDKNGISSAGPLLARVNSNAIPALAIRFTMAAATAINLSFQIRTDALAIIQEHTVSRLTVRVSGALRTGLALVGARHQQ